MTGETSMSDETTNDDTNEKEMTNAHTTLVRRGDKIATHFIYFYSWFWAISSTVYFFCVTFLPISDSGKDFANIILGFLLGTAVATIIGFFYGSSDK